MRHPIAMAALATSSTLLVAALHQARPGMFFLMFGVACFALSGLVRDPEMPPTLGPVLWTVVGAVQLCAFGALRNAHPADPALAILAALGLGSLILGTAAWLRARFS